MKFPICAFTAVSPNHAVKHRGRHICRALKGREAQNIGCRHGWPAIAPTFFVAIVIAQSEGRSCSLCFQAFLFFMFPSEPPKSRQSSTHHLAFQHRTNIHSFMMYFAVKKNCPTVSRVRRFHCAPVAVFVPVLLFTIVMLVIYALLVFNCFRRSSKRKQAKDDLELSAARQRAMIASDKYSNH